MRNLGIPDFKSGSINVEQDIALPLGTRTDDGKEIELGMEVIVSGYWLKDGTTVKPDDIG
jgi:hypothetical protein